MPRHAELRPRKLSSGLWRVDVAPSLSPNRKRLKKDFETEARAKTYIIQLKAHHAHPVSLTDEQTREAHALYSRLPDSLKMPEAVERGIASWQRERTGRTFTAVLDQVLAAKRGSGVTERHLRDIKQKAGRFAEDFGERPLASIERAEIREWLATLRVRAEETRATRVGEPLTAESRNCYRRVLGLVFGFALREGYISFNPIAAVETAKGVAGAIGIFTPDETRRLLHAAREHRFDESGAESELSSILPAVAIGFFAGLRPEETLPLQWSQIDRENRQIDITKGKTAAARPRFVPINDTLFAWLEPYRTAEGRVCPASLWRTLKKIRRKAGITHWPKDVLRHSFASHKLPLEPDIHVLAAIMGNSVEVIHKHYRRPVRVEDAKEFFAILP